MHSIPESDPVNRHIADSPFRQRAERSFGKTAGFNAEHTVESGLKVLPCNCRSQLHELAFGEITPQRREQFIGNLSGGPGQRHGRAHYILFSFSKLRAGLKLREIVELLVSELSIFSANGRMNVDSKRAPHEHGRFEHRKAFEPRRQRAALLLQHVHSHELAQKRRVQCQYFHSCRHLSDGAPCEPVNQSNVPRCLFRFDTIYTRHAILPSPQLVLNKSASEL